MEAEVRFTWWRECDPNDYTELNAEAFGVISFVDRVINGKIPRIVAKGVCMEAYSPLDEFPDLYERFGKVRSQQDVVKFVRTFGPLTEDGLNGGEGDNIVKILALARCMAAGDLHVGFLQRADGLPDPWGGDLVEQALRLKAKLTLEHDGLHLQVEPTNLLDALWFQFADALHQGHTNRCRQCKKLFATGPAARRRRGAEFCSFECKTKFHSLKRSR
jgi:hypothetical protein